MTFKQKLRDEGEVDKYLGERLPNRGNNPCKVLEVDVCFVQKQQASVTEGIVYVAGQGVGDEVRLRGSRQVMQGLL